MSFDSPPGIVTPPVEKYLNAILRPRNNVLNNLEKDAANNGVPIVGPAEGNFLSLMAMSCQAKNILEVGTATGYSGIWLARVAKENSGKLTTIEFDPSRAKIASKSFRDAGVADAVEIVRGDAKEEVPRLAKKYPGGFDLVFIDVGDKSLYAELIEPSVRALRVGGLLVADNTLWLGLVAVPSANGIETRNLREYNKRVYADERLYPVIVPLRDGVTVAIKLKNK
ncbi:MAG: O-methyltransferase [Thaumarchaeota archaeon]|nr:O-methyltransferase [Nitrososphaerota archaeon]